MPFSQFTDVIRFLFFWSAVIRKICKGYRQVCRIDLREHIARSGLAYGWWVCWAIRETMDAKCPYANGKSRSKFLGLQPKLKIRLFGLIPPLGQDHMIKNAASCVFLIISWSPGSFSLTELIYIQKVSSGLHPDSDRKKSSDFAQWLGLKMSFGHFACPAEIS